MHRAAREDPSLDELAPVDWILGTLLRVFGNDIIDLDDFSKSELCAAEGNGESALHNLFTHDVLAPVEDLVCRDRINDPLVADDKALAELVHHVSEGDLRRLVNCILWQDLNRAAFDGRYTYSSILVNDLLEILDAFALRNIEYYIVRCPRTYE